MTDVLLTFIRSVAAYEKLWRDYLNEISLSVLWHGTICFAIFYEVKFGIFSLYFDL